MLGTTTAPLAWKPESAYADGAFVVQYPRNGHYYQAIIKNGKPGTSAKKALPFPLDPSVEKDTDTLSWKDRGFVPVFTPWQVNTAVPGHALIVPSSANGHYYQAQMEGVTGSSQPAFPLASAGTFGSTWAQSSLRRQKNLQAWMPSTAFFVGDVIQDASSGHYCSVLQAGHSGSTRPDFSIPAPERGVDSLSDSTLQWQDFGTSLPSSVSSAGATPSRYMRFPAWWHGMCATGSWTAR